jgi:fumarate hydratase subunit alpha
MKNTHNIKDKVAEALLDASCGFREDQIQAYKNAITRERCDNARWALCTLLENAETSHHTGYPLCDDTGIPHLVLEIGNGQTVSAEMIDAIHEGIAEGLKRLPGRPMNVLGSNVERIEQSSGLSPHPDDVVPAPVMIVKINEPIIRLHVIMQGGGPAIRGRTHRIFHKHSIDVFSNEIIAWSKEAVRDLGCTPCTLAIGVGRSQYEAASLMLLAQVEGRYDEQNALEENITNAVNQCGVGAIGLGGDISVLATFLKVGPQRASGVRITCLRPCCCFEPRVSSAVLFGED